MINNDKTKLKKKYNIQPTTIKVNRKLATTKYKKIIVLYIHIYTAQKLTPKSGVIQKLGERQTRDVAALLPQ